MTDDDKSTSVILLSTSRSSPTGLELCKLQSVPGRLASLLSLSSFLLVDCIAKQCLRAPPKLRSLSLPCSLARCPTCLTPHLMASCQLVPSLLIRKVGTQCSGLKSGSFSLPHLEDPDGHFNDQIRIARPLVSSCPHYVFPNLRWPTTYAIKRCVKWSWLRLIGTREGGIKRFVTYRSCSSSMSLVLDA